MLRDHERFLWGTLPAATAVVAIYLLRGYRLTEAELDAVQV